MRTARRFVQSLTPHKHMHINLLLQVRLQLSSEIWFGHLKAHVVIAWMNVSQNGPQQHSPVKYMYCIFMKVLRSTCYCVHDYMYYYRDWSRVGLLSEVIQSLGRYQRSLFLWGEGLGGGQERTLGQRDNPVKQQSLFNPNLECVRIKPQRHRDICLSAMFQGDLSWAVISCYKM